MSKLARASGVEGPRTSVPPVARLIHGSQADALDIITESTTFASPGQQNLTSALQDLDAGRALEIEETLGFGSPQGAGARTINAARGRDLPLERGL